LEFIREIHRKLAIQPIRNPRIRMSRLKWDSRRTCSSYIEANAMSHSIRPRSGAIARKGRFDLPMSPQ
jgi:hypothetical protein